MSGDETEDKANSQEANPDPNIALEQWKFYGQSTNQVSNRRLKNNRFYLRLLIGLLAVAGIGNRLDLITPIGVLLIGLIGLPFCVLWTFHILSYKQLNSGKYRVLWTLAEELPFDPFKLEWDRLQEGTEPDVYIKHTTVEVWWPRVFGYFYAVAVLWGGISVLNLLHLLSWGILVLTILWLGYALVILLGKSPTQYYWDYTGD